MLRPFLLLLCIFITFNLSAQEARQYSFTRFSTSNGLAANIVYNSCQDQQGFMWFATSNGLQRYDGNSFVTFKNIPGDSTSIPNDQLSFMYIDSRNNLWLCGANNKLGIFDTKRFTFKEVRVYGREQDEPVYRGMSMLEAFNALYLYEPNGALFVYDMIRRGFVSARKDIPDPPNWRRYGLAPEINKKRFWICGDSGIAVYNSVTKNLNYKSHNPDHEPIIETLGGIMNVLSIMPSNGSQLYFTVWPRNSGAPVIYEANQKTGSSRLFDLVKDLGLGYHEIAGFFIQRNGRRWVYGKSFLTEITDNKIPLSNIPNIYSNEQSLKFDNIYKISEDRAGNLWIATDNGLFLFNPDAQLFNVFNLIRPGGKNSFEAPVQAVQELNNGNIFVGCWGAGLYYFDKYMRPLVLPPVLHENMDVLSIWDMQKHSKTGKIWIVMQSGGLLIYDPVTGKKDVQLPEIFQNRTIRQVEEDKDGNLWFGHQGGRIVKWDYTESGGDVYKGYKLVETSGATFKVFCDSHGYIWAGTDGKGLVKIDSRTMKVVKTYSMTGPDDERLFNNSAMDVIQKDDTTLLVAAGPINIINLRTGKVTYFSTAEGLPGNNTRCIQIDDKGILWVGMENGLCRINFEKKIVTNYDRRDGITYDNFSPASCGKLSGGRLAFYTDHNFMIFNPEKLVPVSNPSTPVISTFKLGGKPLLSDSLFEKEMVELDYDKTSFEIEFSSLNFIHQYKLHYYYMMEGLDKDWVAAGDKSYVHYNYLAPGSYVFKVKAIDADGKESGIKELRLHINPPFWRTGWFVGICILTVLVVLFYIDRERMKRLRAVQQTRAAIAGNLHDDIHTTLNNINILSEMAKMKADRDINRSKEYIQQISEKSHNMIIAMDDMLWSIDPKNDTLEQTRQRTREFIDALQSRHEAKINLDVDKKVLALNMDMKMRHVYFLAVKMILRLMVEDAKSKVSDVNVDVVRSRLILKVKSEDASLNLKHPAVKEKIEYIRSRVASINAELDVQVDFTGTSAILIVPL